MKTIDNTTKKTYQAPQIETLQIIREAFMCATGLWEQDNDSPNKLIIGGNEGTGSSGSSSDSPWSGTPETNSNYGLAD